MTRKNHIPPDACFDCHRKCTKQCVDNHGEAYIGCAYCVIKLPEPTPEKCTHCNGTGEEPKAKGG